MIVKVQVPLVSSDPFCPALVYGEGHKNECVIPMHRLPKDVLAAASEGGKAYFYAQATRGRIRFHKRAPAQDW